MVYHLTLIVSGTYILIHINLIEEKFKDKYPLLYWTLTILCGIVILFYTNILLEKIWNGILKMFGGKYSGSNPQGGFNRPQGGGSSTGGPGPGPDPGRGSGPVHGSGPKRPNKKKKDKYPTDLDVGHVNFLENRCDFYKENYTEANDEHSKAQDAGYDWIKENTRLKDALKYREKFGTAMQNLHDKQKSCGMHLTKDSLDEN